MELRDRRIWSLRDLLGVAGEPPTAAGDGSTEPESWYMQAQEPTRPKLVGNTRIFCPIVATGLPAWLTEQEHIGLIRCIRAETGGNGSPPTLTWAPPIKCGEKMKLTLPNRQELRNSPRRLVLLTLRATRKDEEPLTGDHVKLNVAMDDGDRTYFAACLCFFRDIMGIHYVGLRWLTEVEGVVLDPHARLAPLKMSPPGLTKSYSVLPVSAIMNGAQIVKANGKLLCSLSPREENSYKATNSCNGAMQT